MKKLQSNFTTPEQSKRLLELGVPADSADCLDIPNAGIIHKDAYILDVCDIAFDFDNAIPCWSVGRLIEIIRECSTDYDTCKILVETLVIPTTDNVDALVELICFAKCDLDFSKLED